MILNFGQLKRKVLIHILITLIDRIVVVRFAHVENLNRIVDVVGGQFA